MNSRSVAYWTRLLSGWRWYGRRRIAGMLGARRRVWGRGRSSEARLGVWSELGGRFEGVLGGVLEVCLTRTGGVSGRAISGVRNSVPSQGPAPNQLNRTLTNVAPSDPSCSTGDDLRLLLGVWSFVIWRNGPPWYSSNAAGNCWIPAKHNLSTITNKYRNGDRTERYRYLWADKHASK